MTAACFAAAAVSAGAQDIKPMRDKETKKYGYVVKGSKVWALDPVYDKAKDFKNGLAIVGVGDKLGIINDQGEWIQPAVYDDIAGYKKNGLAKVMQRIDKSKTYGIIDESGALVLPVQYSSVSIDHSNDIVSACIESVRPGFESYGPCSMWGVYAHDGKELFAPQFLDELHFNGDGFAVATLYDTRLKGVISRSGDVVVDFNHFGIERRSSRYIGLTTSFMLNEYQTSGAFTVLQAFNGYVIPYDTENDPVRIATYHLLGIGRRSYANNTFVYEPDRSLSSGACYNLRIDWGLRWDRFVTLSLEPVMSLESSAGRTGIQGTLVDAGTGRQYTTVARLYEADGRFVGQISDNGYIEAECAEGVIYVSSTGERWLLCSDVNISMRDGDKIRLSALKEPKSGSIQQAFNMNSSSASIFNKWPVRATAQLFILRNENAGITGTVPYEIRNTGAAKAVSAVRSYPVFAHRYDRNSVWSVKLKKGGQDGVVEAICQHGINFKAVDDIPEVGYKCEYDDLVLYWGAAGDRYISLEPIPVEDKIDKYKELKGCPYLWDDARQGKYVYRVAVNLYEADGSFVRNIAVSDRISHMDSNLLLLEDVGLMFVLHPLKQPLHVDSKVAFGSDTRLTGVVSQLDRTLHRR